MSKLEDNDENIVMNDIGRVTVSIPYYKCREYISKTVESILQQTYSNFIVVVVNDGDNESPWDVLANIDDPRLICYDLNGNYGRFFADQIVLKATSDPFYMIQDADDWSDPDRISILLEKMRIEHSEGCISSNYKYYKTKSNIVSKSKESYPDIHKPLNRNFKHRASYLGVFKCEYLRKIGGLYGGFRIGYDTFIINMLLMTCRISYLDEPYYHRIARSDSLTGSKSTGWNSSTRRETRRQLKLLYNEAYDSYTDYLSGLITNDGLCENIREFCHRRITRQEQEFLTMESNKLCSKIKLVDKNPNAKKFMLNKNATNINVFLNDRRLIWNGWSIDKSVARKLIERISEIKPKRILEIGSGTSTSVLANYVKNNGAELVSFEHDIKYYEKTKHLLTSLGLIKYVNLILAPLKITKFINVGKLFWYATQVKGKFDFVFIDGPPIKFGRKAAMYALEDHLETNWEIWLHDGNRDHEKKCIEQWKQNFQFTESLETSGRGIWILRNKTL